MGSAYEVYRVLGHGFLEKVYETALIKELGAKGYKVVGQAEVPVRYKGELVGVYFADILVADTVICEIKVAQALAPEHQAQLLNYLNATGIKVGLLLNFNTKGVEIKRLVF